VLHWPTPGVLDNLVVVVLQLISGCKDHRVSFGLILFLSILVLQIVELIAQLALHSACGSSILVTVPSETNRRAKAERDPADAEYQWRFGTDDPVGYFTRFGWRTVKHASVEELERQYNRVPRLANVDPSDVSAYVTEGDRMVGGNYLLRALKVA
jgi:hypothetical protein